MPNYVGCPDSAQHIELLLILSYLCRGPDRCLPVLYSQICRHTLRCLLPSVFRIGSLLYVTASCFTCAYYAEYDPGEVVWNQHKHVLTILGFLWVLEELWSFVNIWRKAVWLAQYLCTGGYSILEHTSCMPLLDDRRGLMVYSLKYPVVFNQY